MAEDMIEIPVDNEGITVVDDDVLNAQQGILALFAEPSSFYKNMVDDLPMSKLDVLGSELVSLVEADNNAREEFLKTYEAAIQATGRDGGVNPTGNADKRIVKHVLLNEARIHAHARLMAEMNPTPNQQKFGLIGGAVPEVRDRRDRIELFSNYQLNNVIRGYENTLSRHFVHLTLIGTSYLKTFWDDNDGAPAVQHISAKNLIMSPDTVDLETSKRYTHEYELTVNEYRQYCRAGYFKHFPDIEVRGSEDEPLNRESLEAQGIAVNGINDMEEQETKQNLVFYDVYTTYKFDGHHDFNDGGLEIESPYIITVEKNSKKVVRVTPNWAVDDPSLRRPIQNIIMFKFFDGHGPMGEGFYHTIGGLDKAATAALRDNLEASAKSLNRPLFVGNNIKGGVINPRPGEMIKVKRGDKVRDSFFDMPVMPPDQTMLALMGVMEENARKVSLVADARIEEAAKSNLPTGTVTALIEQGQIAQTGIHKRVHSNMTALFKRLMSLNFLYQPHQWVFTNTGKDIVMFREDFNPATIDVQPTSDPNVASQTMRMAQAQDAYAIAVNHPDLMDVSVAIERLMKASKIPDYEEYFIQQETPPYLDVISENSRALKGEAILAYETQDHQSHIQAHVTFLKDPSLADNVFGAQAQQILYAHVIDHLCMYYKQRMMASIGMPVTGEPLDPQTEAIVSMRVAEVVSQSPMVQELREIMSMGEDPAIETARQMAQLDMEIKQMEAIQERNIRQQKALDDAQERRAKLEAQMAEIKLKADVKAQGDDRNTAAKVENLQLTHQIEKRLDVDKAVQELRQENEKHIQEMRQEQAKFQQEYAHERQMMQLELKKKDEEIEALKKKNEEMAKQPKTGLFGGKK